MQNDFLLGNVLLKLVGKSELTSIFPSKWQYCANEQDAVRERVIIYLEEDSFQDVNYDKNGWKLFYRNGRRQVMYFCDEKPIFALHNTSQQITTVSVCEPKKGYFRLGVQYGMMVALHEKYIGIHGVTLLCGNEIIILSAPSGTGKTTLAKLLEKYCDAIIINGDFALLSLENDSVIFEPTPFCGTSGRSLNHRFRVNRIVFLGQARNNVWHELNSRDALVRFMSNSFIPTWDIYMQETVQGNIIKCISVLKMITYDFAPTQEAAEMFFELLQRTKV